MSKSLYRIMFIYDDKIYEIYAKQIRESEIFTFLEVDQIVFGESSALLVDPAEERLKSEFEDVQTTYIPTHTIIRIDKVRRQGVAKIREANVVAGNVSKFPPVSKKQDKSDK